MSKGYVYILVNDAMPGLVKIGMTTATPEIRAKQISDGTGVPLPFSVSHSVLSPDCAALEALVHDHLSDFRTSQVREFFKMSPKDAATALEELHEEQICEFVGDFLETHMLINELHFIDPSTISIVANKAGVNQADVDMLLLQLTEEELQSAAYRLGELYKRRRLNREAQKEAINHESLPEFLQ